MAKVIKNNDTMQNKRFLLVVKIYPMYLRAAVRAFKINAETRNIVDLYLDLSN